MPRLNIDDGYTLDGETAETWVEPGTERVYHSLPVVRFKYRPALPDALQEWTVESIRAATGREKNGATAKLLADHLTSWDVLSKGDPAPIDVASCRVLPYPIQQQILAAVIHWAPRAAADLGNSSRGSGSHSPTPGST